jgi:hypothetical protein
LSKFYFHLAQSDEKVLLRSTVNIYNSKLIKKNGVQNWNSLSYSFKILGKAWLITMNAIKRIHNASPNHFFLILKKNMAKSTEIGIESKKIISKDDLVNNNKIIPIQNHRNINFRFLRIGIFKLEI